MSALWKKTKLQTKIILSANLQRYLTSLTQISLKVYIPKIKYHHNNAT